MLDIRYIEQNFEHVVKGLHNRGETDPRQAVHQLLHKNEEKKKLKAATDELLSKINQHTAHIAGLLKKNDIANVEIYKTTIKAFKSDAKKQLAKLKALEKEIREALLALPNLPHPTVLYGKTYEENTVVKQWSGNQPLAEKDHPHWKLMETYKLVSFKEGNKITGAGFPVYHGKGARLQRGLVNFFLDQAIAKKYQEVQPPLIVNRQTALGTGQIPDKENTMYILQEKEEMYLIPTAEVPVTNLYSKMVLQEKDLPIKHVAYTPCFRREAGSWGFETRGLKRIHQFDKVELVIIEKPTHAMVALEEMLDHVCSLLEQLGLTYRVLKLCTGELSFSSALTYDVEVWAAGQKEWLEVSSVSLFETFQSIRMQLRYKEAGKKHFCHTLNGSGLALPRLIIALLENFQTRTGIHLPPVLHPYLGFKTIGVA